MDYMDSQFITLYKEEMLSNMKQMNPDWDESKMESILDEMIKKRFVNPEVTLDNNYTGDSRDTTLLSVFDWVLDRKPLIAGNGTFYKNQYEAMNPIAELLDFFLKTRKKLKKEMFKIENTESNEYKDLDRGQNLWKVNANSYYGSSGAPSSAFYSTWSGPATTLSAQSVISSAKNFFESFLADNYAFLNSTELIHWMNIVVAENNELDSFIKIKSIDDVCNRLVDKIIQVKDSDRDMIYSYLSNLNDDEITILYYKNNILEFMNDHKILQDLVYTILSKVQNLEKVDLNNPDPQINLHGMTPKDYNKYVDKEYFMDPNDAPSCIKEELDLFKKYIMKYVFTKYLSFDRIYRLRNFKRRVVTVIDTDSNILSIDIFINWILDNIVKGESFGRDFQHNSFILVNMITYVITDAIEQIMLYYGEMSNIPEEFRPRYNMKNEFFMSLLVIGRTKKRYISKILLREGNFMNPPKQDIKGFDFKKATCSEYAEKRFMKLIKQYIIDSPEVDLRSMIIELRDFENEVRNSIISGERTFLPNGSAKELAAYKDPASEQSVRGALAWNAIYPNNSIDFPSKVSLVKMNIFDESDCEGLKKTHPEIYNTIIEKIFNDETGMFVSKKWESDKIDYINPRTKDFTKLIPKKYRSKFKDKTVQDWNTWVDSIDLNDPKYSADGHYEVKKRGLQVLAIPSNSSIPEWAIPYIDMNTMVNNIIAPFKPVMELFNNRFTEEGKTKGGVNRKTDKLTNIVKF